jgi:hypothetical protein
MQYWLYYCGYQMGMKACKKRKNKKQLLLRKMQRDGIELSTYNKGYVNGFNVEMNRMKK